MRLTIFHIIFLFILNVGNIPWKVVISSLVEHSVMDIEFVCEVDYLNIDMCQGEGGWLKIVPTFSL